MEKSSKNFLTKVLPAGVAEIESSIVDENESDNLQIYKVKE